MPKKTNIPTEPFWRELVDVYFTFCKGAFPNGEEPGFDGSSPRDFKAIIVSLRTRTEKKNIEWSLDVAKERLTAFLVRANQDEFLHNNFVLSNINRQKDKLFLNPTINPNDQSKRHRTNQPVIQPRSIDINESWR